MLEPYADAMIVHHPHVIQRLENRNGKIRAYSLGGVNMSKSADYVAKNTDFQDSVRLYLNVSKDEDGTVLDGYDYSLLYAEEDRNQYVRVNRENEHLNQRCFLGIIGF